MITSKVCVYDHDGANGPLLGPLKTLFGGGEFDGTFEVFPSTNDDFNAVAELAGKDLLIAHIYPDPFIQVLNQSKPGMTRVRVSSGGVPILCKRTNNGVNALYLWPMLGAVAENTHDLRNIIEAIRDPMTVSKIVTGEAACLAQYFRYKAVSNADIVALAILCQGYIVAAAAPENQMGLGPPIGMGDLVSVLCKAAGHIEDVTSPAWWRVFRGKATEAVGCFLKGFDLEDKAPYLQRLAEAIDGEKAIDDSDLVERAYNEIDQLLKSTGT